MNERKMGRRRNRGESHLARLMVLSAVCPCVSFGVPPRIGVGTPHGRDSVLCLPMSDWQDPEAGSANFWASSSDDSEEREELMAKKEDGSLWSEFEPSTDNSIPAQSLQSNDIDDSEAWLDTLASISAEEVDFNRAEAEKADKVRQMQEWGFDDETIENTFGVAVDDSLESDEDGMKQFRDESYELDEENYESVQSHTKVPRDPETGEPIRAQMVWPTI